MTALYLIKFSNNSSPQGNNYIWMRIVSAPFYLKEMLTKKEIKKLFSKKPIGVKIKNREILSQIPNENSLGISDSCNYDNFSPDFFVILL